MRNSGVEKGEAVGEEFLFVSQFNQSVGRTNRHIRNEAGGAGDLADASKNQRQRRIGSCLQISFLVYKLII